MVLQGTDRVCDAPDPGGLCGSIVVLSTASGRGDNVIVLVCGLGDANVLLMLLRRLWLLCAEFKDLTVLDERLLVADPTRPCSGSGLNRSRPSSSNLATIAVGVGCSNSGKSCVATSISR